MSAEPITTPIPVIPATPTLVSAKTSASLDPTVVAMLAVAAAAALVYYNLDWVKGKLSDLWPKAKSEEAPVSAPEAPAAAPAPVAPVAAKKTGLNLKVYGKLPADIRAKLQTTDILVDKKDGPADSVDATVDALQYFGKPAMDKFRELGFRYFYRKTV